MISNKYMVYVVLLLLASSIGVYAVYTTQMNRSKVLAVSTTTSLYVTGLLDRLSEEFKRIRPDVELVFIAVGSGQALRLAEQGDVCVVFVHAPSLERVYVDRGVIVNGTIFAYNYFVIAGPSNDPAGIKGLTDPVEAFRRIYYAGEQGKAVFVSRGDNSGTHVKELSIWDKAGLDPSDKPWYIEAGQGMGGTLVIAGEKKGYVLTDISTYLKYKAEGRTPQIEALVTQGQDLINIYSVYAVNSCPEDLKGIVNDLIEYVSNDFQEIIANYGLKQYGVPLFNPAAGEEDWLRSEWMRLASGHVNT